jgi:hypothetical protein
MNTEDSVLHKGGGMLRQAPQVRAFVLVHTIHTTICTQGTACGADRHLLCKT